MPQRILIVEPERHAREGLRAILVAAGHHVSVADSIAAGFERVASEPFDLLLLDADLPPSRAVSISVLDLLRFARRGRAGASGILVASCADDLQRNPAPEGVVAVLEKPVELSRLCHALKVAEARSARRPEASPA